MKNELTRPIYEENVMVSVTHGVFNRSFDVGGQTIAYLRKNLESLFGIPADAVAILNGEVTNDEHLLWDEEHVLLDNDDLDFLREYGSKGALSPEEMSFLETGGLTLAAAAKLF